MSIGDRQLPWIVLPKFKFWLKRAIESDAIFHLVIHPWELVLQNSLKPQLSKILGTIAKLRNSGKLETSTMKELARLLDRSCGRMLRQKKHALKETR